MISYIFYLVKKKAMKFYLKYSFTFFNAFILIWKFENLIFGKYHLFPLVQLFYSIHFLHFSQLFLIKYLFFLLGFYLIFLLFLFLNPVFSLILSFTKLHLQLFLRFLYFSSFLKIFSSKLSFSFKISLR